MNEKIYFATTDGKLIDNHDVAKATFILTGEMVDPTKLDWVRRIASACNGVAKEIKNPSIEYLIKRGFKVQAVKVYHDKHPELSLKECAEAIERIEKRFGGDYGRR